MLIEKRISAFNELGRLFDFITNKSISVSEMLRLKFISLEEEISLALREAEANNNWLTRSNIFYSLGNWASVLNTEDLLQWLNPYNFKETNKNIGIVMAGNLPLVGFHDLLSVVISGNNAIVKTSTKDEKLMLFVINYLYTIDESFKDIIKVVDRLESFDAVIATGSNNTSRYFEQYFSKVPNIIRKNRTSIAVINGSETKKELEKLGEDIFRYFGLGCRNITKIYFKSDQLISFFLECIADWGNILLSHPKYVNNYEYNRAIYLLGKEKFLDNNFLLLKEDNNLHSPISVINYEIYSDINELKSFLIENDSKIQCVVGKELKGDKNYVEFGHTQAPSLNDFADNIDVLQFLCEL